MVNDTELICQNAVVTFGVERKAYKMKYEKQVDYTIDKRFTSELNRFTVGGEIGAVIKLIPVNFGFNFERQVEKSELTETTKFREHTDIVEYQEGFFQMMKTVTTDLRV